MRVEGSSPPDPRPDNDPRRRGKLVASVLAGAWRASPPPSPSLSLARRPHRGHTPAAPHGGSEPGVVAGALVRVAHLRRCPRTSPGVPPVHSAGRPQGRPNRPGHHATPVRGCRAVTGEGLGSRSTVPRTRPAALWRYRPVCSAGTVCDRGGCTCRSGGRNGPVDLHNGLPQLHRPSLDDVYGRSQLVPLGDFDVRILGPEDHLRYMCIHMLQHGAYRALWLCDIAVVWSLCPRILTGSICCGETGGPQIGWRALWVWHTSFSGLVWTAFQRQRGTDTCPDGSFPRCSGRRRSITWTVGRHSLMVADS